jgi:hypothetical protein
MSLKYPLVETERRQAHGQSHCNPNRRRRGGGSTPVGKQGVSTGVCCRATRSERVFSAVRGEPVCTASGGVGGGRLSRAYTRDPIWGSAYLAAVVPGQAGGVPFPAGRILGAKRTSGGHAGDAGAVYQSMRRDIVSEGSGFCGTVDGRTAVPQHVLATAATHRGGGCKGQSR